MASCCRIVVSGGTIIVVVPEDRDLRLNTVKIQSIIQSASIIQLCDIVSKLLTGRRQDGDEELRQGLAPAGRQAGKHMARLGWVGQALQYVELVG
jgi:hypothetical protein